MFVPVFYGVAFLLTFTSPYLIWTLAILVSVGASSVERDALHDPVIEHGAIDRGYKARLVTHTLWSSSTGGQGVG
jgi:hypothetical protein